MKFRFCGDGDCPDWVLAEINSLSRLSSIKLKLLCQAITESWEEGKTLNVEKIQKLLVDAKLDSPDQLKATVACINFILTSSTRHECDESALISELQQLGLPQEHSQVLKRVYTEQRNSLAIKLKNSSLKVNRLEDVKISNSEVPGCLSLELTINGKIETVNILRENIPQLLKDLKYANGIITELLKS